MAYESGESAMQELNRQEDEAAILADAEKLRRAEAPKIMGQMALNGF